MAQDKYKARTIEYRRCGWLATELDLEKIIRKNWPFFQTTTERQVERSDDDFIMGVASTDMGRYGFAIHCAVYVDGQAVGTVPMEPLPEVDLGESPPSEGQNYRNSDFTALIKGNHVLTCGAGMNAARLRTFLSGLFKLAKEQEDASKFDLRRIADANVARRIHEHGVVSVDLNADMGVANFVLATDGASALEKANPLSAALRSLEPFIKKDETYEGIRNSAHGTVSLKINVPKRDIDAARSALIDIAENIIAEDQFHDYEITLGDGNTIKPGEMTMKKNVRLRAHAESVSHSHAWEHMQSYMLELMENKVVVD